jgi:hypothetical protein
MRFNHSSKLARFVTDAANYSWSENYAGSSGLQSPLPGHKLPSLAVAVSVDQLEMDRFDQPLVYCPLLDEPAAYVADTVDLTQDTEARYGGTTSMRSKTSSLNPFGTEQAILVGVLRRIVGQVCGPSHSQSAQCRRRPRPSPEVQGEIHRSLTVCDAAPIVRAKFVFLIRKPPCTDM